MSSNHDDGTERLLTDALRAEAERVPLPPERYDWLESLAAEPSPRPLWWHHPRIIAVAAAAVCLFIVVGAFTPPGQVAARGVKHAFQLIATTISGGDTNNGVPPSTRTVPQGSAQTGSATAIPTTSGTASAVAPVRPAPTGAAAPVQPTQRATVPANTPTPAAATPAATAVPGALQRPTVASSPAVNGAGATPTPQEESKSNAPPGQSAKAPNVSVLEKPVPTVARAPNKVPTIPVPGGATNGQSASAHQK